MLSDLLSVTGPITLPVRINEAASSTYVGQSGDADPKYRAGGAGKSIVESAAMPPIRRQLSAQLYAAIFQQLASSTMRKNNRSSALALNWITNKDVMVYFTDPDFETFANAYGATGDVYQLPRNFNGDYLAIANADINSDKSELYVAQNVTYDATINSDGTLTDSLIIKRTHNGNQSPYWWYQDDQPGLHADLCAERHVA